MKGFISEAKIFLDFNFVQEEYTWILIYIKKNKKKIRIDYYKEVLW